MKEKRLNRVLEILERLDLHACVIKGMDNIFYLTGFYGTDGTMLVTRGDKVLTVDSRYATYACEVAQGCEVVETKNKDTLKTLFERYGVTRTGFDSFHTMHQTYKTMQESNPDVTFVPIGSEIESIRAFKDHEELLGIRRAISIATKAFSMVVGKIEPGRTEKEIANELDYTMRLLGADAPSFETIVASGPNAALPHAHPSDRPIESGEAVIIDFGCRIAGYCSDETCTVAVGRPRKEIVDIHRIVLEAKQKGAKAVRAGMPAQDLDMIVRGFIEEKGYGNYFGHGTGHGVGIAVHEAPTITAKSADLLDENMVITIEPGIYLPHIGGVRLEDMILVTEHGGEILTNLRKDLFES